ncbi:unnamed protein product [Penicillium pancosmium]
MAYTKGRATNTGEQRLRDMNESGVAMQILSLAGPVNYRFRALGELPFHAPELAATELRRCINDFVVVGAMMAGSVRCTGKFLDDPEFDELLSEFEALDIPL